MILESFVAAVCLTATAAGVSAAAPAAAATPEPVAVVMSGDVNDWG